MAQNIAVTVTLQQLITNIRRKTGLIDPQNSGLTDPQITDLIHTALLDARIKAGKELDNFYQRYDSVTFSAISAGVATVSVTSLNIASLDPKDLRLVATLSGTTNQQIPIMNRFDYDFHRQRYSTTAMTTTGAIGTIYLTSATPNILTLEIYTGASTIASAFFLYKKNPTKVTAIADTVDIPDQYTPIIEDYVVAILQKTPTANLSK